KIAESKGFEVLNLKDKGSDKYYLRDVMHLGTKGWVDVCERLLKYLKNNKDLLTSICLTMVIILAIGVLTFTPFKELPFIYNGF
ncbi:hypothetical protein BM535_19180, partial [Clostridioides difficile]